MPSLPPSVFKAFRIAILKYVNNLRATAVGAAKKEGISSAAISQMTDKELSRFIPFSMEAPTSRELARTQAITLGKALELSSTPFERKKNFAIRKQFMEDLDKAIPKDFKRIATGQLRESGRGEGIKKGVQEAREEFFLGEVDRLKRKRGLVDELDERRLDQIPPEDLAEIRSTLDSIALGGTIDKLAKRGSGTRFSIKEGATQEDLERSLFKSQTRLTKLEKKGKESEDFFEDEGLIDLIEDQKVKIEFIKDALGITKPVNDILF